MTAPDTLPLPPADGDPPSADELRERAVDAQIRAAFLGVAAATLLGTAALTLVLFGISALRSGFFPPVGTAPVAPANGGAPGEGTERTFTVLMLGICAAMALTITAAWVMLAPLGTMYRRGGLAIAAAFGVVIFAILTVPINQYAGQAGLLAFAAATALAGLALARRLARRPA